MDGFLFFYFLYPVRRLRSLFRPNFFFNNLSTESVEYTYCSSNQADDLELQIYPLFFSQLLVRKLDDSLSFSIRLDARCSLYEYYFLIYILPVFIYLFSILIMLQRCSTSRSRSLWCIRIRHPAHYHDRFDSQAIRVEIKLKISYQVARAFYVSKHVKYPRIERISKSSKSTIQKKSNDKIHYARLATISPNSLSLLSLIVFSVKYSSYNQSFLLPKNVFIYRSKVATVSVAE